MKFRILTAVILALTVTNVRADPFADTIALFRSQPALASFFAESYGYAVFPTIGKGGIGLGAAYGKGRVYRGGGHTGDSSMVQVTIGFQLGGQAYSEMIFFKNKDIYDEFTSGNFEFGAGVSAVALTAGAQAGAGTGGASASAGTSAESTKNTTGDWFRGMAVFTIAKGGLMYEASVGGQGFSFDPVGGDSSSSGG